MQNNEHNAPPVDFGCRELSALLPLFVDGEFEQAERSTIEQHLATCSSCARQVHALRAFKNSVARSVQRHDALQVPPGLTGRIRRRTQRARAARNALRLAAPASAAAIIIGFFTVATSNAYSPIVNESLQRHMDNAQVDFASPSPRRIERTLMRRLGRPVRVPTFRSPRIAFRGARLVRLQNKPAAYLVYGTPRSRISVLAMPDPSGQFADHNDSLGPSNVNRPLLVERHNGFNVVVWHQRGTLYSMVSDLDSHEMMRLLQNSIRSKIQKRPSAPAPQNLQQVSY